jgi:transposase
MQKRKTHIKKLRKFLTDPCVDIWSIDEVHFQQYGSRCLMWVPPEESDPVLLHHPTRKSVGYFGAVRLRDGKVVVQKELERFNGMTFHAFLKELYRISCRGGRRVVAITDNARYHHAKLHAQWREENSHRFALNFLPAYSPELNPIERLWKLTRRLCVHNRYFPTWEDLALIVESQFANWRYGNEAVRKLYAIT